MAKVTSVLGNSQKLDGGSMFGNCPRAVWEKWMEPDDLGRVRLSCRCLLLQDSEGRNVLFETGIGAFFEPKLAGRFGVENPERHVLLENLKTIGLSPSDIDIVILSHLHFDHAGGLLPSYKDMQNEGAELVFSNATFLVGREAMERAKNPHMRDRASFIPEITDLLLKSGRLEIVDQESCELMGDRYEFYFSEGHTPGQMHTLYKGDSRKVFFCGDLIPGTPWVHVPITMGYDRYPEKLIDEKQEILERALKESWYLFYTHDTKFACSEISKDERGKYSPTSLIEELNEVKV